MARPKGGRYYLADGKTIVPSVTTVLSRFKESGGLIYWAWQQGRDGKDFREERDKAAEAGSLAHALVEAHLRGEDVALVESGATSEVKMQAQRSFANFMAFQERTGMTIYSLEEPMVSELYHTGGTADAILQIEGKLAIGDWKTGGLYVDHLLQVAAYKEIYEETHPGVKLDGGYHLLRFSRESGDFTHHYFSELDAAWGMFLYLRRAYELDRQLKKRVK